MVSLVWPYLDTVKINIEGNDEGVKRNLYSVNIGEKEA
jgi:hypothetical protein